MDIDLTTLLRRESPASVRDVPWPGGLRALVLAPHPDDFDAVGVTLAFLRRSGAALDVAVVPTGRGVEDAYRPGLTLEGRADLREREQRASLHFFGLPGQRLRFLRLKIDAEGHPLDIPANRDAVTELVSRTAPHIVFLPHGNDTNKGHRVIYSLLRQVCLLSGRPPAALLNRDPKTVEMRTDLYMPFGQREADWKAELLRYHDSQHQRNLRTRGHGFDERVLAVNRRIARELSLDDEYAEAYEVEIFTAS